MNRNWYVRVPCPPSFKRKWAWTHCINRIDSYSINKITLKLKSKMKISTWDHQFPFLANHNNNHFKIKINKLIRILSHSPNLSYLSWIQQLPSQPISFINNKPIATFCLTTNPYSFYYRLRCSQWPHRFIIRL